MIDNSIYEMILKIFLTVLLSGIIGGERELRQRAAGLRTHVLVAVGSALIVLTSISISEEFKNVYMTDPTRIISNIVTGIGFLCAGTIIRGGAQIRGLTTAATVWIVSAIGMAVGAGCYTLSIVVTIVVFIVLVGLRSVEKKIGEHIQEFQKK